MAVVVGGLGQPEHGAVVAGGLGASGAAPEGPVAALSGSGAVVATLTAVGVATALVDGSGALDGGLDALALATADLTGATDLTGDLTALADGFISADLSGSGGLVGDTGTVPAWRDRIAAGMHRRRRVYLDGREGAAHGRIDAPAATVDALTGRAGAVDAPTLPIPDAVAVPVAFRAGSVDGYPDLPVALVDGARGARNDDDEVLALLEALL